jgi:HD-GYP domain-containing protein (c-di-GMP phosphodiesterase class II)
MTTRNKHVFCFVIVGQAACVGVGLWLEHHVLKSAALNAAEKAIWSEIEADAAQLSSRFETLDAVGSNLEPPLVNAAGGVAQSTPSRKCCVTVVDSNWRIRAHVGTCGAPGRDLLLPGQTLSWTSHPGQPDRADGPTRGLLDTRAGPHLAVMSPIHAGDGYVLTHQPVNEVEARAAPLTESLGKVMVVTLLWTITLLSITVYLILVRFDETLSAAEAQSASSVLRQTQRLVRTRDAVIFALAKLASSRDDETGAHLERLSDYCTTLSSALRHHPKFSDRVTPAFVWLIGVSCGPHDIGKVGIPDAILRKPGPLTPEERTLMQQHTVIAGECLRQIADRLGTSNFLEMAIEIALAHHERWDGTGYPKGLRGEEIPLSARIVAIADVYDALATKRPYKDAMPHRDCVAIIRDGAGMQFDPDIVQVWLSVESKFRDIAEQHKGVGVTLERATSGPAEQKTGSTGITDRETAPPPTAPQQPSELAGSTGHR